MEFSLWDQTAFLWLSCCSRRTYLMSTWVWEPWGLSNGRVGNWVMRIQLLAGSSQSVVFMSAVKRLQKYRRTPLMGSKKSSSLTALLDGIMSYQLESYQPSWENNQLVLRVIRLYWELSAWSEHYQLEIHWSLVIILCVVFTVVHLICQMMLFI